MRSSITWVIRATKLIAILLAIASAQTVVSALFQKHEEVTPLTGGGKMVKVKEGEVYVDTKIYAADGTLLKHSWNDYAGQSHCNDYDENGELVRSE